MSDQSHSNALDTIVILCSTLPPFLEELSNKLRILVVHVTPACIVVCDVNNVKVIVVVKVGKCPS